MHSFLEDTIYSNDNNDNEEWYTPVPFVKAVQKVLGCIDLDPASCALANRLIGAKHIYTKEENGLAQEWHGNIFCNPPYGRIGTDRQRGQTELWVNRLIEQYNAGNVIEAILLVNAYLYKQWFQPLYAYPICIPSGRLAFWNAQGASGRSPHSSAFVYFGQNVARFEEVFLEFGPIGYFKLPKPSKVLPDLWTMAS